MAKVSLSQAAKDTGVSLPTLSRWRKNGKISAKKTGSGGYLLDTSEYDRINALKKTSPNMKGLPKGVTLDIATHNESNVLQVEVKLLRERLKDKDGIISDRDNTITNLREDMKDWKTQAQTLLLKNSNFKTEKDRKVHKGFFFRIFGL